MSTQSGLERIAEAWTEELHKAIGERSGWAFLGRVEALRHRGTSTLGGHIDRRMLPVGPGDDPEAALEAWRRSADGRIVDRALAAANGMLLSRLPPPSESLAASDPWLDRALALASSGPSIKPSAPGSVPPRPGAGDVVALGIAADLLVLTRSAWRSVGARRLHACAVEGRPGRVALAVGEVSLSSIVAMVSAALGPEGIHLVTVIDVKTKGAAALRRLDVVLGS